tara:strand:+ start:9491 stop:10540 length:1050 start_codon:yes stop_codon:yes gene_type:complete
MGLKQNQIKEIREHLNKAQNPLFFFDNDADGLCSFLILQRYCEKGKGVAIKSYPELIVDYFRKVQELNADYIFILDKPKVSEAFFEKAEQFNIPIVWIDHHNLDEKIPEFVNYYNPALNESENIPPTTYLGYQVSEKKDDLWIAVVGSISDKFMPDFYPKFKEKYPDLSIDSEDAFELRYKSEIGKIVQIFSFALKDRTTNVVNMLKFLMKVKTPYEVLEESSQNSTMHQRFNQINSKFQRLLEKAKDVKSNKFLFFQYSGDLSISSDLADELNYIFPEKIVVVAYISGLKVNISARGKDVKKIILKAIEGLNDSTGGGHEEAVGAKIKVEDLNEFKRRIENFMRLKDE